MAKKRSCRRTADESAIHERAVKMRKMTDEQLVHYVEAERGKARSEWSSQEGAQEPGQEPVDIDGIIEDLGSIRGLGAAKLGSIRSVLEKRLTSRAKRKAAPDDCSAESGKPK